MSTFAKQNKTRATVNFTANVASFNKSVTSLERRMTTFKKRATNQAKITFVANTGMFNRSLDAATKRLQQFQSLAARYAKVTFTADTSSLTRSIKQAGAELSDFKRQSGLMQMRLQVAPDDGRKTVEDFLSWARQQTIEIPVAVSTAGAMAHIAMLSPLAEAVRPTVNVGASTRGASAAIRALRAEAFSPVEIPVKLDTSKAIADATRLKGILAGITRTATVDVEANVTGAATQLSLFDERLDAVDGRDATARVGVSGIASSMSQLTAMDVLLGKIGRRRVRLGFDAQLARKVPTLLGDMIGKLMQFQTTAALIASTRIPALLLGLGAIGSTATVAAGGIGGLVTALGQGLAGAAGTAGVAVGLGGAALLGYRAVVTNAISSSLELGSALQSQQSATSGAQLAVDQASAALAKAKPGTDAYRQAQQDLASAQATLTEEQQKLALVQARATPQMLALGQTVRAAQLEFARFGATIMSTAAPAIQTFIDTGVSYLPALRPHVVELTRSMNRAALSFLDTAQKGQNLRSIQTILFGIKQAGAPALSAVGDGLLTIGNVLQVIVPDANALISTVSRLAETARRWSASGEGQQRIADIWALLSQRGTQLSHSVWNLAQGFYGVFAALNQSGVVDLAIIGFQNLTSEFRNLMSASGEGRSAVTGFLIATMPVMSSLVSLGRTIASEFFRVVGVIGTMKDEATGNLILVDIIGAIEGAVVRFGNMLTYEFSSLGPLIAPLITNFSKIAEVFLVAQPPMIAFLKVLNSVLTWFNSLDKETRRTIASIVSFTLAFGPLIGLFGGGSMGGLGGMLTGFVQMRQQLALMSVASGTTMTRMERLKFSLLGTAPAATRAAGASRAQSAAMGQSAAAATRLGTASRGAAAGVSTLGAAQTRTAASSRAASASTAAMAAATTRAGVASKGAATGFVAAGGGAARAGTSMAQGASKAGIFTRMGGALKVALSGLALAFTGLSLPVTLAVAAIAGAAYLIYRNWSRIRPALQPVVDIFNVVLRTMRMLGSFVRSVFVGDMNRAGALFRMFPKWMQPFVKNIAVVTIAVRRLAEQGFRWLRDQGARLASWWNQNLPLMQRTASVVFSAISTVVGTGLRMTFTVVRAVVAGFLAFWRQNNQQILSIARSVWNIVRSTISTAIRVIGNVVKLGMQVLTGDFRGAGQTLRRIWTLLWNHLKVLATNGWNILKNLFQIGLNVLRSVTSGALRFIQNLWTRSLTAIRTRATTWGNNVRSVFTSFGTWARGHWNAFWSFVSNLWLRSFTGLRTRATTWGNNIRSLFTSLGSWARNHWTRFWNNTKSLFSNAFQNIWSRTRRWRGNLQDIFSQLADSVRSIFRKMAGFMTNPIQSARDNLKRVWNGILEGIGRVMSAVKIPGADKVRGAKWARGGIASGAKREATGGEAFARGGIAGSGIAGDSASGTRLRAFARGGIGTSSRQPRIHVWNEQMGPEGFAVKNRPSREQVPFIRTMAEWHDHVVVPKRLVSDALRASAPRRLLTHDLTSNISLTGVQPQGFLRGGLSPDAVQETVKWAKRYNGRGYTLGGSHPGRTDCSGWMNVVFKHISGDKSPSGRSPFGATMTMRDSQMFSYGFKRGSANPGFTVGVSHGGPAGGHTAGTLAWGSGEINTETGGGHNSTMTGGPAAGANGSYNNQFIYGLGKPGNISGAGGGILASLWDLVGERIWNATVGRAIKSFKESMEGGFVMRQAVGGAAGMAVDAIKDWIVEKAGASSGGGEWTGGGNLTEWITKGFQLSGAFPPTPENVAGYKRLAQIESSGKPDAIQQIQDINSGGNEARGLMQVTPQAWSHTRRLYGTDLGEFMQNWMNPIKSVAARARNQKSMLGHISFSPGYEKGGMIPGFPGDPKIIQAHAGEIVLPRGVSDSFLRFSDALISTTKTGYPRSGAMTAKYGAAMSVPGIRSGVNFDSSSARAAASVGANHDTQLELARLEAVFREELAALRDENRRLNEEPGQQRISNVEELVRMAVLAALAAQMSDAGKEIQDLNFAEQISEFRKLLGAVVSG